MHGDGGSIDQVNEMCHVSTLKSQHTVRDDDSALGVLHGLHSCHKAGSSTVPRLCHRRSSLVLLRSTYQWPFLEGSSMAVVTVTGSQRQSQGITMAKYTRHMPQRRLQIWHPYSQNLRGDKSEMGKSTCSFDFCCVVRLMILYCLLFLSFIELLTYLITLCNVLVMLTVQEKTKV